MGEPREVIKSRSNLFVRRLRGLIREGREEGLVVIEGIRLAEDALEAGVVVLEAAATVEMARHARGRHIVEELNRREVPVRWVDTGVMASLSDVETSQGLLLLARRPDVDSSPLAGDRPLVLFIAGVQDPGNLGSLLRLAEAAGVTGVFIGTGSADPFSSKALRGAMGSTFRIPMGFRPSASEVTVLRRGGVSVWAATAEGTPYDAVDWRRPSALVVGNEGAGLPEATVKACDGRVAVPMAGRVESLNVAVAAGIILFEAARQRRERHGVKSR
jgi:TrmH family RNA methyltransferase